MKAVQYNLIGYRNNCQLSQNSLRSRYYNSSGRMLAHITGSAIITKSKVILRVSTNITGSHPSYRTLVSPSTEMKHFLIARAAYHYRFIALFAFYFTNRWIYFQTAFRRQNSPTCGFSNLRCRFIMLFLMW